MNSKAFVIALVAAVAAISFAALTGFWPFGKSPTEQWLNKIGLPEGAVYVGKPEISDQDGTKPEMLMQEVAMDGEPASIRQEFAKRCVTAGLEDTSAVNPSTAQMPLCKSKPGASDVDFFVDATCEGTKCRVLLELHKYGL